MTAGPNIWVPFVVSLILGAAATGCAKAQVRGRAGPPPTRDEGFGDKCAWLAVKTREPEPVAGLLRLRRLTRVTWREGMDGSFEGGERVFVTPPIDGWVLAIDPRLVLLLDLYDKSERLARLSEALQAPVQLFISDRRSGTYAWMKAEQGRVTRAFIQVEGKVRENRGPETPEEKELRAAASQPPNMEQLVPDLAGRWSVDPSLLYDRQDLPGLGLLGEPPPL